MQKFDVEGMSCEHCARTIEGAIRRVDGAASVEVDLAGKTVTVQNETAAPETLREAIEEEGYEARAA